MSWRGGSTGNRLVSALGGMFSLLTNESNTGGCTKNHRHSRPIRLADVLLAISYRANEGIRICAIDDWVLRTDDLTAQSDKTVGLIDSQLN